MMSSLFFCALIDHAKSESRRSPDAFSALTAAPKSSNVFLRGADVCAITLRVTGSIFSIPPQSGHITSNGWSLSPMRIIPRSNSMSAIHSRHHAKTNRNHYHDFINVPFAHRGDDCCPYEDHDF